MLFKVLRQALMSTVLAILIANNNTFTSITEGSVEKGIGESSITQINIGSRVSEVAYDFGQAREGMVLRHTLKIYNPLSEEIKIINIKTECACTVLGERPQLLRPMSATDIPIEVRLRAKASGLFEKKIVIGIENNKDIKLKIKGWVAREYPRRIDFNKIKQGECHIKEFAFAPPDDVHVNVKKILYDKKFFAISANNSGMESNTINFKIQVQRKIPTGTFSKRITIITDDTIMPNKTIMIKGYILDWLETTKKRLFLGELKKEQTVSRKFTIYSPYNKRISQLKIISSKPGVLNYEIARISDDYTSVEVDVRLENKQNSNVRYINEKLIVEANVEGERRQITIPVLAIRAT